MTTEGIKSLKPAGMGKPITVRALRKWLPQWKSDKQCYLFVDEQGDGIEASTNKSHAEIVDQKIKLLSCHGIRIYGCVGPDSYKRVVDNPTAIIIGPATVIDPLLDNPRVPKTFFQFYPYDELASLIGQKKQLIDFVGVLQRHRPGKKFNGDPYIRLTLKGLTGPDINVTIWNEVLEVADKFRFDIEALDNTLPPLIVAITSLEVQSYLGRLALSSTTATYVYINPDIPANDSLKNRLETDLGSGSSSQLMEHTSETTIKGERVTIASLLKATKEELKDRYFACTATPAAFIDDRTWHYNACRICMQAVLPSDDMWFCQLDSLLAEANHAYCISIEIEDSTETTTATIFDEAVENIIGIPCKDLINKFGHKDPRKLPPQLQKIIGHVVTFQLQIQKERKFVSTYFTCNHIAKPTESLIQEHLTPSTDISSTALTTPPLKEQHPAKKSLFQDTDDDATKSLKRKKIE